MSTQDEEIMKLTNVSKIYMQGNQQINALSGINFTIHKADFIALLGPSGSGKSTFLNLISLVDSPTKGTISYQGVAVNAYSERQLSTFRSKNIGIIFQNYNLIPVLTALENVMLPLQIQKVPKKEAFERASKMLGEVGLANRIDHFPTTLSGGQRQRVAIARALITNPSVVIADEPTAALDSQTATAIIELLKFLNETKQITFVFSTHDPKIIQDVHDIIRLKDGLINPVHSNDLVGL